MVNTNKKILIYTLKHPITLEVRYVGMTSKTLKQRFRKHMDNVNYTKHNLHLCNWINMLFKENLKPLMETIEEVDFNIWKEKEIFYISKYENLLNATIGGEGSFGFKHSDETKERIRQMKIGNTASVETKQRMSNSGQGRIFSSSHKDKIGDSNRGNILTQYKISVLDTDTREENIFDTIKDVTIFACSCKTSVYRSLNKSVLLKKKYIVKSISKDIV